MYCKAAPPGPCSRLTRLPLHACFICRELESACLALGLDPSQRVLDRFLHVSPVAGSVDLATVRCACLWLCCRCLFILTLTFTLTFILSLPLVQFVRVCMTRAGGDGTASSFQSADSSESLLLGLFAQLDTSGTGRVPLATLLHVLAEVDTPSALSVEEVQELLRMTGILNERTLKDPRTLYAMEVDYSALVKHLTFALPVSVGAGGGGAAASAKAATGRGASASASSAASATPSSLR